MCRQDELKIGTLVGTDKYGNKYYENNEYFYGKVNYIVQLKGKNFRCQLQLRIEFFCILGRNRWVDYNAKHGLEYDGSMVPAEWFGWLHYKTDSPPTKKPPVQYKWLDRHTENLSGTSEQYVPFTTTRPKIESWVPPKKG